MRYKMNQILVTEKLYITPEIKRKKRMYKIRFFLSVFLICVLFSYYIYAENDRNKSEEVAHAILSQIENTNNTIANDNTTKNIVNDVLVIALDEQESNDADGEIHTSASKDIRTFTPSCSADDRTRHFLKVQDGCDYFCSYCTIPFARGRSRNGSIESLVKQAEEVAAQGGREIVLTGVNIGDFGKTTGETFLDLIRALDEVEGIDRYRISSIEPNLITDEAIDFVAGSKRFAPHFHIPLQSGSDDVLKLMRRRYDTALFRHKIEKIKSILPDAFIGVDVIVGTRGETDAYFEDARRFIESLDVTQLHVFSYSERPGTQALKIDYVVDPKVKHIRSQILLDLSEKKLQAFYEAHIGREAKVLFEHTKKDGMMHGFTENYIKVETPYDASLINETRRIRLGGWNADKSALQIDSFIG